MNRNDFLDMIGDPSFPGRNNTGELNDLIKMFPYFQSAHLLLLKSMKDKEDIKFGNQLRFSAVHVADREVLYMLLQKKSEVNHAGNVEALNGAVTLTDSATSSQQVVEMQDQVQRANQEQEESDSMFQNIPVESPVEENLSNDDIAEEKEVNPTPGLLHDELLELEPEFLGETSGALRLDEDKDENEKPGISQAELIDRFIIANPRIEPARDRNEIPAEDRSSAVYGEGGFVSETLANIYISQGYYSKAMDIFEKLSLKYPEKSSYFATQIEKVKAFLKK